MPDSNYNEEFGGEPGSAAKAHAAMKRTYTKKLGQKAGAKKAESVFYATVNSRKQGQSEAARRA